MPTDSREMAGINSISVLESGVRLEPDGKLRDFGVCGGLGGAVWCGVGGAQRRRWTGRLAQGQGLETTTAGLGSRFASVSSTGQQARKCQP